jgi:hypothetical protein
MAAFQASQFSVGTTAVELVSGLEGRYQIIVEGTGAGTTIYLGDSSVSSSNGFLLGEEQLTMDVLLDSMDALYALFPGPGEQPLAVMVNPR